jgi:hypothetical protein
MLGRRLSCPHFKKAGYAKTGRTKRQAYGFRDMEYFKLRLYHLHTQRYSLTG